MQKYLDDVNKRIKANPWQFTAVFLVVLVCSILAYMLIMSVRVFGPIQFGMIIPNFEFLAAPVLLTSYASVSQYLLLCLAVIGSIAVGSFLMGGYLSCLDAKETLEKKSSWFRVFFIEGLSKFVNVFIASLISFLVLYLLILLLGLVMSVTVVTVVNGFSSFGALVFVLLLTAAMIMLSIFFVFIPYEATFSKESFWTVFKVALKKSSKVFGSLLLVTFVMWFIYFILWWITIFTALFGAQHSTIFIYIMSIIGFLMALLAATFFYFPLYKKASVIMGDGLEVFETEPEIVSDEPETVEPEPERVHKTEYIGSDNLVFHKTSCWHVKQIAPGTEDYFETREEAIKKGYEPCKHCKP